MNSSTKALLQIHTAVLLFGASALIAKLVSASPSIITGIRTFIAALVLGAILRLRPQRKQLGFRTGALTLLPLGALLAVHWWTFFTSVQTASVAVALIAFSSFPVFVAFLEPLFFRTRIDLTDVGAAACVLAGVFLIAEQNPAQGDSSLGVFWGLLSGFTFALLQVLNRRRLETWGSMELAFVQSASACVCLLPFLPPRELTLLQGSDWLYLGVLGVFCTAVAHNLFIDGMKSVTAQTASFIAVLEPVYGTLLGALILGEIPSGRTWTGGALVLSVAFLMGRKAGLRAPALPRASESS